ncbi:hypothetical protein BJ165DRAFT_849501 [Panaeolus papilionaceus]|nr:hypothetical protein BJ165DRAFT_849501 [Panaeolus papilionaceus]
MSGSTYLPIEIWELITSYLARAEVERLCSVNSALLHIVLDMRYNEAVVAPPSMYVDVAKPRNLVTPVILDHVRVLVFTNPPEPIEDTSAKLFDKIISLCRPSLLLVPRIPKPLECSEYFGDLLSSTAPSLHRLQAVKFEFSPWFSTSFFQEQMLFFGHICVEGSVSASNITNLSLDAPLDIVSQHWPKSLTLPNLQHLAVYLWTRVRREAWDDTIRFVVDLINNHSQSLSQLDLSNAPLWNLESVLTRVNRLPKLQILSLCYIIREKAVPSATLGHFMSNHASHLVDIRLRFVQQWEWFCTQRYVEVILESTLDLHIPNLRHLSLYYNEPCAVDVRTIKKCLRRHQELTSLVLLTRLHTDNEMESGMCLPDTQDSIARSLRQLRSLTLAIIKTDISLVLWIAYSVPQLEYLSVRELSLLRDKESYFTVVKSLLANANISSKRIPKSASELSLREFEYVAVIPFNLGYSIRQRITESLPTVVRFCGTDTASFLETGGRVEYGNRLSNLTRPFAKSLHASMREPPKYDASTFSPGVF